MLVKDQIKSRLEQLEITVPNLAKWLSVSDQTVRYWLSGRNLPGKRHRAQIEGLLSCRINWSEAPNGDAFPSAASLMDQADIEIMMKISRLPLPVKVLLGRLADTITSSQKVHAFSDVERSKSMSAFSEKVDGNGKSKPRRRDTDSRKQTKGKAA